MPFYYVGVRPIVLCKDASGRIGVALESISKGIFVAFVYDGSPAALAGLRFGDQILQVSHAFIIGICVLLCVTVKSYVKALLSDLANETGWGGCVCGGGCGGGGGWRVLGIL